MVARHLRRHPEDADRLHAYWRQEALLYRALGGAPDDAGAPAPRTSVHGLRWALPAALAGALLLFLIVPGGHFGQDSAGFVDAAFEAYQDRRSPASEMMARLAALDLEILGWRQWQSTHGMDIFEYRLQDPAGATMALYAAPAHGRAESPFRMFERGGVRLMAWTAAGRRYALVGEDALAPMAQLATNLRSGGSGAPALASASAARPPQAGPPPSAIAVPGTNELGRTPALQPGAATVPLVKTSDGR